MNFICFSGLLLTTLMASLEVRVDLCNLYSIFSIFTIMSWEQFEIKLRRICKGGIDFLLHHYSFLHFEGGSIIFPELVVS